MDFRAIRIKLRPLTRPQRPFRRMSRVIFLWIVIMTLGHGQWASAQEPINWVLDELYPGHDLFLEPDQLFFTEGSRSCSVLLTSERVPYLTSWEFEVNPGSSYQFSADVFDNDTLGTLKIYADFYDLSGFPVFGGDPVLSADSSHWQVISWAGTVPENAVKGYVRFKFYCQPGQGIFIDTARAWIDRVTFIQDGGANLVLNGGFEDWTTGIGPEARRSYSLKTYPNPCKNQLFINSDKNFKDIRISSSEGRQILWESFQETPVYRLDLTGLPKGIYFISVGTENGRRLTSRLVKN